MKASLSLRDEQKPLVRVKIPVSILGLPFLSGISAGDAPELRLDLGTAFNSGPSLRVSYRPNDLQNPFTLAVKTGIGPFGSPAAAAMTMCAEFGLVGRGAPSFTIQIKPRLGDFCLRKSTSSTVGSPPPFVPGTAVVVGGGHEAGGEDRADGAGFLPDGGTFAGKKPNRISTGNLGGGGICAGICDLLSGAELTARSVLPLRNRAAVKFRWGVRVPSDLRLPFASSSQRLPLLVVSKVSIEHVPGEAVPNEKPADVAEACFSVQRQLAALQAENGMLRKAVEELRADLAGRGPVASGEGTADKVPRSEAIVYKAREGERNGAKVAPPAKNGNRRVGQREVNEGGSAATKEDVNEELRKALLAAGGGGGA